MAAFFGWPLGAILARGLAGTDAADAWDVLSAPWTVSAIATTAQLAVLGTAGSLALGIPTAHALYRVRWRGRRVARAVVTVPFVLPTVVVAAAFGALFARSGPLGLLHLDQSILVIVLALVFFNVSVVARIVGSAWAATDPSTAIAARTLGASRWRAWRDVTAPALAPATMAAGAVVFLFCSASFGIVLVLGGGRVNTVETQIYLQVGQFLDLHAAAVLALVQVVFVAVAFALSSIAGRRGALARGGREIDGSRAARRSDLMLTGPVLGITLLLVLAPMLALIERSLRTGTGHGLDHYRALVTLPARAVLPVSVAQAAANSFVTAAIATVVAAGLATLVAVAVTRGPRWIGWIDAFTMAPLGVSAVVIGLGMLLTLNRSVVGVDLRQSWWIVPIAQAVVALPFAIRILVPAMRGIEPRLRAAAASLGASPLRTWRTVDAPLLRGSIALAVGFCAAIALGEFGATSFVARPDRPTLPTAIARLLGRPGLDNVGMGFAAAVVLAVLTGAVLVTAEGLRTRVRAA